MTHAMDLQRMLDMCRRDQWSASDLDWTQSPRALSRDDEIAVVQLFTDMSGIETLAGELFAEQERRTRDPILREIFHTFVIDEKRHSAVAARLARFYDVHRYQTYATNPHLVRFRPHFVNAIRHLDDDVANAYITGGELILDVALLRSINDYVADPMSAQAMELINRDESRHIAIDYHMVEYYASDAYADARRDRPRKGLRGQLTATWTLANMFRHARPFFRDVFFRPMDLVDPSGARIKEAFRRMQLIGAKPDVARLPFMRFVQRLHDLSNHPQGGRVVGEVLGGIIGIEGRFMRRLYTDEELERARGLSFDQLAQEALAAKSELH
jgi:hypothetical protein